MKRKNDAFKIKAVKLSNEIGVKAAARKVKIGLSTMANWRNSFSKMEIPKIKTDFEKPDNTKKLKELEIKNEILIGMLRDELRA